jgi:hypothetical protein
LSHPTVTITTTGTNLPDSLDAEVSTTDGLTALFTAGADGYSAGPSLIFGDYEVRLVVPATCQVPGTNPVPVNPGTGSNHGDFTVSCT